MNKAFDHETIIESQNYEFDTEKNTIIDHSMNEFDETPIRLFKQSPAVRASIIKNGGSEDDFELYETEKEDQDDDNDEKMIQDFYEQFSEMYEKSGFVNIKTNDNGRRPGNDIHEMGGKKQLGLELLIQIQK